MAMARNFSASFFRSNPFFRRLLSFGGSSDEDSTQATSRIFPDPFFSSDSFRSGRIFPVHFFSSDSFRGLLRSFASSDDPNQTAADTNHPSPRDAENPIRRAMDMETGSPTADDPEQDSKPVRKLEPTVSLAVAALCWGIYASIPPTVQLKPDSPLFYDVLIAFISLGVFTSLCLFIYSLMSPERAEVLWVQKVVVAIAIIFFFIAFLLRIALLLPVVSFGSISLVCFLVTTMIALCLYLAWKKDHHSQSARDPNHRLPISLPLTDGGGN